MFFKKEMPGMGMSAFSKIQNGKAMIILNASLEYDSQLTAFEGLMVEFQIIDAKGDLAAVSCIPYEAECSTKSLLIYPQLWQACESPYVYTLRVSILDGDEVVEELESYHVFRTFSIHPTKGYLLNDVPFQMRGVKYNIPFMEEVPGKYCDRLTADLKLIQEMGANTVCIMNQPENTLFYELCDRIGLMVWKENALPSEYEVPEIYGKQGEGLISKDGKRKRDSYYYYKACWSQEPFVYICKHDNNHFKSNETSIMVYSNQKKIALYVDGILFEMKESAPSFHFENVPLKPGETIISAQAGNYYHSMTLRSY